MLEMLRQYGNEILELFEYLSFVDIAPFLFFLIMAMFGAYSFGRIVALKRSRFAMIVSGIACLMMIVAMSLGILNVYAFGMIDGQKTVFTSYCKTQPKGYVPYRDGMTLCPGQWTGKTLMGPTPIEPKYVPRDPIQRKPEGLKDM